MHNALQDATQTKHDAIDTVWRLEAAKVIATVARRTLDGLRHSSMVAAEHEALARVQWLRAAKLTRNACERELLLECAHNTPPEGGIHECPCRWFCGEAQAPH